MKGRYASDIRRWTLADLKVCFGVDERNRSRGRGYGPTLEVRERPVTRLYVGE
ncbi:hypothetical protein PTKU46_87390 [Paraburkholderia terrae]